jgi:hypothetical protein
MLTLHALRIKLNKSYRVALDLLSQRPGVLAEIGLTWFLVKRFTAQGSPEFRRIRGVRFSALEPRNAQATVRPTPQALTAITQADTTLTVQTTASEY